MNSTDINYRAVKMPELNENQSTKSIAKHSGQSSTNALDYVSVNRNKYMSSTGASTIDSQAKAMRTRKLNTGLSSIPI